MISRTGNGGYSIEAFPSSASESLVSSAPAPIVVHLEVARVD